MPDLIGQMLQERYRIEMALGQGGMGAVYKALDTRLNVYVALKELTPQYGIDPGTLQELRKQFQQEATVLARLNHPNLVAVSDYFQDGQNVYLVMQYVEGLSLDHIIKRDGALREDQVLQWTTQLMDALSYCHSQGVIHRDIKPQNIIIKPSGQVVLVDFGLVKLWDPNDPQTRSAVRGIGTPQYAPPEQYATTSGHTDSRSDLYSLGATLYHALTGVSPPTATSRIASPEEFYSIRVIQSSVSTKTANAIEKAMELQRLGRWSSAVEMAYALGLRIRDWGSPKKSYVIPEERLPKPLDKTSIMRESPEPTTKSSFPWMWVMGIGAVFVSSICAVLLLTVSPGGIAGILSFLTKPTREPTIETATASVTPIPDSTNTQTLTATLSPTMTRPPTNTPASTENPTVTPLPSNTPAPTEPSKVTPRQTPIDPRPDPVRNEGLEGRIVFTRNDQGHTDSRHEIYLLDINSFTFRRLTQNNVVDWDPNWSPDGRKISFVSFILDNYDIWTMDADGSNLARWIGYQAWDDYPSWSPDSRSITFVSTGVTEGIANSEIFISDDPVNQIGKQVTFNTAGDEWPDWSPEGNRLACSSNREGNFSIYLFNADGSDIVRWTDNSTFDEQPVWSPDGTWIAFIRKTGDTNKNGNVDRRDDGDYGDIWIGRVSGSEFQQLTFDGMAADPAWSPDGHHIVYSHFRDSNGDNKVDLDDASDLWVIRSSGGSPIILTNGPEQDWSPDWTQ